MSDYLDRLTAAIESENYIGSVIETAARTNTYVSVGDIKLLIAELARVKAKSEERRLAIMLLTGSRPLTQADWDAAMRVIRLAMEDE